MLEGGSPIVIPKHLISDKADGLLKIQFTHVNVKSPLEYAENQDGRKIKFGLKALQFTRIEN
jgi:hypothetical protein